MVLGQSQNVRYSCLIGAFEGKKVMCSVINNDVTSVLVRNKHSPPQVDMYCSSENLPLTQDEESLVSTHHTLRELRPKGTYFTTVEGAYQGRVAGLGLPVGSFVYKTFMYHPTHRGDRSPKPQACQGERTRRAEGSTEAQARLEVVKGNWFTHIGGIYLLGVFLSLQESNS